MLWKRLTEKVNHRTLRIEVIDGGGNTVEARVSSLAEDYHTTLGCFLDTVLWRIEQIERKIYALEEKNRRRDSSRA
jgi:hypothetical protein